MEFGDINIAVIGDLMYDNYIYGDLLSKNERSAPIFKENRIVNHFGGAGNVAQNILKLGGNCIFFYNKSWNRHSRQDFIIPRMRKYIDCGIYTSTNGYIIKNRYIDTKSNTQILRHDIEQEYFICGTRLYDSMKLNIQNIDGIIISDYGKGMINEDTLDAIFEIAETYDIPVYIDPCVKNYDLYKSKTPKIFKPNIDQLSEMLNLANPTKYDFLDRKIEDYSRKIMKYIYTENLLVTCSKDGMYMMGDGGITHYPNIYNQTTVGSAIGAGDVVIAAVALSDVAYSKYKNYNIKDAIEFSRIAIKEAISCKETCISDKNFIVENNSEYVSEISVKYPYNSR